MSDPETTQAAEAEEVTVADEAAVTDAPAAADDGAAAASDGGEQVSADLDELADARKERDEYLQLAQRARADFENFRKRAARDAEEAERRGRADLAKRLLPAIDNLERALLAVGGKPTEAPTEDASEPASREIGAQEALLAGIALVHHELVEGLRAGGVEVFDPLGEPFDPSAHEALSTRPAPNGEASGVVIETLERGYRTGETLLRPARVVVSQ